MARKVNTFVRTSPNCFANAGYVVSGDAALLRLKDHRGIRIVKPAEFLTLLPPGPQERWRLRSARRRSGCIKLLEVPAYASFPPPLAA